MTTPKLDTGCAVRVGKDNLKGSPSKEKVYLKENLLIRNFWTQGTDSIHDMCVVNTDATSYQSKTPEKCLETAKNAKKRSILTLASNIVVTSLPL